MASAPQSDVPEATRELMTRAQSLFGTLPDVVDTPTNPVTEEKVKLGRLLYYEKRLSRAQDMSCNTCHDLANYGVDVRRPGAKTSEGHEGAFGDRNSPTVYNAALHVAQFWDGRAKDLEEQAQGPILNPIEMAMPAPEACVSLLRSISGYLPLFQAAFPKIPIRSRTRMPRARSLHSSASSRNDRSSIDSWRAMPAR